MPAVNSIRFVELARLIGTAVLLGRAMTPSLILTGVGTGFPSSAQSSQIDLSHQEIGAPPQEFEFWRTGRVDFGHWAVVREGASVGGFAIQGSGTDRANEPLLALYTPVSAIDATIKIRFKLIDGSMPSAGIAARVTGPDDYYVVRVSAFEQRLSLLHIVRGKPEEIAGVDAQIAQDHWQTLEVGVMGNGFTIWLDDEWALTAFDYAKLVDGQFGIWTERDDTTRFGQIDISPLPSVHDRSAAPDRVGG
jgi:hypothetical protein